MAAAVRSVHLPASVAEVARQLLIASGVLAKTVCDDEGAARNASGCPDTQCEPETIAQHDRAFDRGNGHGERKRGEGDWYGRMLASRLQWRQRTLRMLCARNAPRARIAVCDPGA